MLRSLDSPLVDADVIDIGVGFRAKLGDGSAPLTVTRPSSMSFSAARREAMPAAAMIFCSRTSTGAS
jgi:hypothetical protein